VLNKVASDSSRKTICPGLDPVTEIVNVSSCAPPSGNQQLGSGFGLDELQMRDPGVVGVCSEAVLLVVGAAENVVSKAEGAKDSGCAINSKGQRVD
jgi:hypothetical protein